MHFHEPNGQEKLIKRSEQTLIDPVIPKSPKRQIIDDLISNDSIYGKDANPFYDEVEKLEGVEIVERRDYQKDEEYRCAWHAFKNETWWPGERSLNLEFWDNTEGFLVQHDYARVEQPQDGDIVLYKLLKDPNGLTTVKHIGVFQDGKVISKFNQGHVFKHDLGMVPNMFGESVIFMRKRQPQK